MAQIEHPAAALEAAMATAANAGQSYAPGTVLQSNTTNVSYELQAQLGTGAFGEVWRCSVVASSSASRTLGDQAAVKIVRTEDRGAVAEEVAMHKRAVKLAGGLFIPKFYEDADARVLGGPSPSAFIIVMQLIEGLAANRITLPTDHRRERVAKVILYDVLVALGRLHAHGLVHRDVKPANVLVNGAGECYLCDFGVSMLMSEVAPDEEMTQCGTPSYMAPEMVRGARYNEKVDVWSLGIMGYEFDLGRTPFQKDASDIPNNGIIVNTLRTMVSPVFESSFGLKYRNFVQMCLEADHNLRVTSTELVRDHMPTIGGKRKSLAKLVVS